MSVEFKSNIPKAKQALSRAAGLSVQNAVLRIHETSVARTPVDEGPLRETSQGRINNKQIISFGTADGRVGQRASSNPNMVKHRVTGVIGYTQPYAVRQHEDLTLNHPNGGQAKFLESAYLDHKDDFQREAQETVQEELKRALT